MEYEYECKKCGYYFTKNLIVPDRYEPTLSVCPRCKEYTVKKIISLSSFKIKGFSSKNGFSDDVGDVEKHLGRQLTNEDLD